MSRKLLWLRPMTVKAANKFVKMHHRHHKPTAGGLFAAQAIYGRGLVVGVMIVGRPNARMLQDGFTAEVTRLCTLDDDLAEHAASKLYAAAWRAARAVGYRRCVTYILKSEPGTSLKAAGWKMIGEAGGGSWSRPSRRRVDKHPLEKKVRWEVSA